jgi:hypothetical protein
LQAVPRHRLESTLLQLAKFNSVVGILGAVTTTIFGVIFVSRLKKDGARTGVHICRSCDWAVVASISVGLRKSPEILFEVPNFRVVIFSVKLALFAFALSHRIHNRLGKVLVLFHQSALARPMLTLF